MFTCPICHKELKDLKRHVKSIHPDDFDDVFERERPDPAPEIPSPEPSATGVFQDFALANVPAQAKRPADVQLYHCVDCGHKGIIKGTPECPKCGTGLDWSAV